MKFNGSEKAVYTVDEGAMSEVDQTIIKIHSNKDLQRDSRQVGCQIEYILTDSARNELCQAIVNTPETFTDQDEMLQYIEPLTFGYNRRQTFNGPFTIYEEGYTYKMSIPSYCQSENLEITCTILFKESKKSEIVNTYFKSFEALNDAMIDFKQVSSHVPSIEIKQNKRFIKCMSAGQISCILGKPKTYKTTAATIFEAAVLTGRCGDFKSDLPGKVAVFDSEQTAMNLLQNRNTVQELTKLSDTKLDEQLKYYSLRNHYPNERRQILKNASFMSNVGLIVIDNITDFMVDINSNKETREVTQLLLELTGKTKAHVLVIIHENKSNSELRGAIGTEIKAKAETVIQIEKKAEIATLKPVLTRGQEFEPISFKVGKGRTPMFSDIHPELAAISADEYLTYSSLSEIMIEETGKSKSTITRLIKKHIEAGNLEKDGNKYRLSSSVK